MHRLDDRLRRSHRCRIERRLAPRHIERQAREVHDASVAAVAAQIVRGAHEDAVDGARFHAQSAEHALGIVDRVAGDFEALRSFHALFPDVDAVHGTGLRAGIASDARRQVEAVKATIASGYRHRLFGILKVLGESAALGLVRDKSVAERDAEALANRVDGEPDVAKPVVHGGNELCAVLDNLSRIIGQRKCPASGRIGVNFSLSEPIGDQSPCCNPFADSGLRSAGARFVNLCGPRFFP